ncbi:MAG: sorbosone dehydrogenase family protein [Myxococcota bacterium]
MQPVGSNTVVARINEEPPVGGTGPYNPNPPFAPGQIASAPAPKWTPIMQRPAAELGLQAPAQRSVRDSVQTIAAAAAGPSDALPINVQSSRPYPELGVSVQTLASGLNSVWSMAYAPNGDVYFTERPGRVRLIRDGVVQPEPVMSLQVGGGEGGLLGMALDPNFAQNRNAYLYYTASGNRENRVVRVTLGADGRSAGPETVLVSGIPAAGNHNGGRIAFGPDGKLYITTGDAGRAQNSQSLGSLAGKILRVNSDGTAPSDNPFVGREGADARIWSYGHRNPQGLGWNSRGDLVASEFGSSANDEINLIRPGSNYGWPNAEGDSHAPPFTPPLAHAGRGPSWAPSGSTFLTSDKIPQWRNNYFMSMLGFSAGAARGVQRFEIDENNVVRRQQNLFRDDFGRVRSVSQGPDGYLYMTTSNLDGRGPRLPEGDRILRIVPLERASN